MNPDKKKKAQPKVKKRVNLTLEPCQEKHLEKMHRASGRSGRVLYATQAEVLIDEDIKRDKKKAALKRKRAK